MNTKYELDPSRNQQILTDIGLKQTYHTLFRCHSLLN